MNKDRLICAVVSGGKCEKLDIYLAQHYSQDARLRLAYLMLLPRTRNINWDFLEDSTASGDSSALKSTV